MPIEMLTIVERLRQQREKRKAKVGDETLLRAGLSAAPVDWSPDGKSVLYQENAPKTGYDLWLLPVDGDHAPVSYVPTPFNEQSGTFSPDGRWVAYQSDESGQSQVYVQGMPATGAKYQISTSGGTQPRWRRDGKELYYFSQDQKLMAAPIALGAVVEPGTPHALFTAAGLFDGGYAPSRDGQRFLVTDELERQRRGGHRRAENGDHELES